MGGFQVVANRKARRRGRRAAVATTIEHQAFEGNMGEAEATVAATDTSDGGMDGDPNDVVHVEPNDKAQVTTAGTKEWNTSADSILSEEWEWQCPQGHLLQP